MRRRIGVLDEPILGMQERHDRLGDVSAVDEVVEYHLRGRVLQEFAAVMHHQQRIRLGAAEPSRQIQGHRTVALHRAALHDEFGEFAWCRVVIRKGPLGRDVASRKADRNSAEGAVRQLGVQGVVETLDVIAAAYLDLVVDARAFGHLEHEVPERRPSQPPHRESAGQAENPLRKVHLVRLAPKQEGAMAAFDDGNLVTGKEATHGRLVDHILLLELVDGEATGAASGRPGLASRRSATHWAYTCTVLPTSSRSPRNAS